MQIALPLGLKTGDCVVTNAKYAKVYSRGFAGRKGIITSGRHIGTEVMVHLDGAKNPQQLDYRLFDVVK